MPKNTSKLRWEILSDNQRNVFTGLKPFAPYGVLGGGTALALQLFHRRSFDLDIFTPKPISKKFLYRVKNHFKRIEILADTGDELTFISPVGVKISFVFYPFKNLYPTIKTPYLDFYFWKDISLDKAHTIGRRGEWRDYVDMYFIIKGGLGLTNILKEASKKFGDTFSEKLFLSQLCYYGDVHDFTVEFLGKEVSKNEIQNFLKEEVGKIKI